MGQLSIVNVVLTRAVGALEAKKTLISLQVSLGQPKDQQMASVTPLTYQALVRIVIASQLRSSSSS